MRVVTADLYPVMNDPMDVIWHYRKPVQSQFRPHVGRPQPFVMGNPPAPIQHHFPIDRPAEETFPPLCAVGHVIAGASSLLSTRSFAVNPPSPHNVSCHRRRRRPLHTLVSLVCFCILERRLGAAARQLGLIQDRWLFARQLRYHQPQLPTAT